MSKIRNDATVILFSVASLESGKAHLLMSSGDVMVPGASSIIAYTSALFHDPNPLLYAALHGHSKMP